MRARRAKTLFVTAVIAATAALATSAVEIARPSQERLFPSDEDCHASGPVRSIEIRAADEEADFADERSRTMTCRFDRNGHVIETLRYKEGYPEGKIAIERETSRYNEDGFLVETSMQSDILDKSSHPFTKRFGYDRYGRMIAGTMGEEGNVSHRFTFEYDNRGNLVKETSINPSGEAPDSREVLFSEFDSGNRLVYSHSTDGSFTRNGYDTSGRKVRTLSASGNQLKEERFTYDTKDRVTVVETKLGTIPENSDWSLALSELKLCSIALFRYNADGFETESRFTDAEGKITAFEQAEYDAQNSAIRHWTYQPLRPGQPRSEVPVIVDGAAHLLPGNSSLSKKNISTTTVVIGST